MNTFAQRDSKFLSLIRNGKIENFISEKHSNGAITNGCDLS